MNLHAITHPLTHVAIWLTTIGRNGRTIGDHLWVIEEGQPPALDLSGQQTWNRNYWTPSRYLWRPFNFHQLMHLGWVQPLCGRRSQSVRPRVSTAWGTEPCETCIARATERGIIPLTYNTAVAQSTVLAVITAEHARWVEAGRPNTWPPT